MLQLHGRRLGVDMTTKETDENNAESHENVRLEANIEKMEQLSKRLVTVLNHKREGARGAPRAEPSAVYEGRVCVFCGNDGEPDQDD